jgi:murein DD-endopeptidase MepM/ murein hydrolase activator NlpD
MFSPLRLTDSCFAPKAVGVALVATCLVGCSPDLSKLDNRSSGGAAHSLHPTGPSGSSFTRTASGLDPFFVVRPKADVPIGGSSHSNSIARSPSPKTLLAHLSKRHREQKIASTEGHAESWKKEKARGQHQIVDAEPGTLQAPAKMREAEPQRGQAVPPFNWPLNGKILASFGSRSNGLKNEGIAIAVPEDTPITCAEDGEVIYAGSGLKGYGNLVLVRHANDYVTVYAHAKEISVRRGDQIKRGHIIGSSGQTGNVSTPQLYFEIRKGTTPVDPIPLLVTGTGSSQIKQGGA